MKILFDKKAIGHFKGHLAQKLNNACAVEGVEEAREETPVWSKRLHNSARAGEPVIEARSVHNDIIFGGVALPGELEEINVVRDVDYALDQETEKSFLRGNLDLIGRAIVEGLAK